MGLWGGQRVIEIAFETTVVCMIPMSPTSGSEHTATWLRFGIPGSEYKQVETRVLPPMHLYLLYGIVLQKGWSAPVIRNGLRV